MQSARPVIDQPRVNFGWISESFYIFQRDAGVWVGAVIIYTVIVYAVSFGVGLLVGPANTISASTPDYNSQFWRLEFSSLGLSSLALLPIHAFFYGGLYKMSNKAVRGGSLGFGDLFSGGSTTVQYIIYLIAFSICTWLGLLAILIGAIVVCALLTPGYALLADGIASGPALQRSWNAIKADWLNATALVFVVGLLFFLSSACIVGALVTYPMSIIIASLAYRDMIGMPAGEGAAASHAPLGSWPPAPQTITPLVSPTKPEHGAAPEQEQQGDERPDVQ